MNERNERNGAWCSGRTGAGGVDLRFLVWCSVSVQDVCALGMLSADRSTHSTIPQFPQISYPSKMGGISIVKAFGQCRRSQKRPRKANQGDGDGFGDDNGDGVCHDARDRDRDDEARPVGAGGVRVRGGPGE